MAKKTQAGRDEAARDEAARDQGGSAAAAADKPEHQEQDQAGGQPGLDVAGNHGSSVPTLGLGDEQISDEQLSEEIHGDDTPPVAAPPPRARQGDAGRPYCPQHNCLQVATGTTQTVTHYACPVPGCKSKEKRARPQVKIPAFPQPCPQRSCRDEHGKPIAFLEVDPRLSGVSHLRMVCKRCGFKLNAPRPHFNQQLYQQQRSAEQESLAAR